MESTIADVCSICSEVFWLSERILVDDNILQVLTFLITKINTTVLHNTQICKTCLKKIQDAYNFKLLNINNTIETNEDIDLEMFCMCYVCRDIIKKSLSISLSEFTKESKYLISYLPENLDLETLEDHHICVPCQESVWNFYDVLNMLSIHDESDVYKKNLKVELFHYESSNNGHQATIKEESLAECCNVTSENSMVQNENINIPLKEEVDDESKEYCTYETFMCKNEELDLKVDCESSEQTCKRNEGDFQMSSSNLTAQQRNVHCRNNKNAATYSKVDGNVKIFSCDICGYKTKRRGDLTRHTLVHNGTDTFTCDICGHRTKQKGSLKIHMVLHKSIEETEMYECEACDYKTKHKYYLKTHTLIHRNTDDIQMFLCNVCGYKTKQAGNIKKHMLKHKNADETEMFKCDYCEHRTKYKYSLKIHRLQHKSIHEIEVFPCHLCEYKAKRKDLLKKHSLVHKRN